MSEQHHGGFKLPQPEFLDASRSGLPMLICGGVGVVSLIISLVWGFFDTRQFAFSWLFSFTFFFTIAAGGLFWVMLHHATDSAWSVVIRRQAENLANLFPWLAILFLPIAFLASSQLYSWMTIDPKVDHLLHEKEFYLKPVLFYVRAVGYFFVLSLVARMFKRHSTQQDASGAVEHTFAMRRWAFGGLPLFAVSLTFAAIDWLMALDYTWFSTMWGPYIFAGSALSAMAVLILFITWLKSLGYLQGVVSMEHYHIMGKLLFAFTVFWAYVSFSQYMLIWYANIPEETSYFLRRNTGSWNLMNIILVIGHFFLPFVFLIRRRMKTNATLLCVGAVWLLIMHMLDLYIIVLPVLHAAGFAPHVLDVTSFLAIGGLLAFLFLSSVGKVSLFAARDPRIIESLKCSN